MAPTGGSSDRSPYGMSVLGTLALGLALLESEVVIATDSSISAEAGDAIGRSCSKVFARGEGPRTGPTCSLRSRRDEDADWFEVRSEAKEGGTVVVIEVHRRGDETPIRMREVRFSSATLGAVEGESIGLVIAALQDEPKEPVVVPDAPPEDRAPPPSTGPTPEAPRLGPTRWGSAEVLGGMASLSAPSAASYFGGFGLSFATGTRFEPGLSLRFGGGLEPTEHYRFGGSAHLDFWFLRGWVSAAVRVRGQVELTELEAARGGESDSGGITQGGFATLAVGELSLGDGWGWVLGGGPTWLWPPTSVQVGSDVLSVGQVLGWEASVGLRLHLH